MTPEQNNAALNRLAGFAELEFGCNTNTISRDCSRGIHYVVLVFNWNDLELGGTRSTLCTRHLIDVLRSYTENLERQQRGGQHG